MPAQWTNILLAAVILTTGSRCVFVLAVRPINVIAHMVNTPGSVRWALNEGANGVEIDLRFNGTDPYIFRHSISGEACDCSCFCAIGSICSSDSVCKFLWNESGGHCGIQTSAEDMTLSLGEEDVRSQLALIYIDSKLTKYVRDYALAGAKVVQLLNRNVFDRGYQGQVIIGCPSVLFADYLKGAIAEADQSKYSDRYYYTFDSEGRHPELVWHESLELPTHNLIYSTGTTSCSFLSLTYSDAIKSSLAKDAYAAVGIWTLDRESSMKAYVDAGVDFILTNKPSVAANIVRNSSFIPVPGKALQPKYVPNLGVSYWECDCNYHTGGCIISKMAPPNFACECTYKVLWRCTGQTVACNDSASSICKKPDASKAACLFGGGDCGGY